MGKCNIMKSIVSVIVPCYNQAFYLDEALQSVWNQTHQNWECIIVDDGSADSTKEVALKWCDLDERFLYFYKINGGLSSARNAGLQLVKGDYIQLLDADDLIHPTKFEVQLKDLKEAQIAVANYFSFVDGYIELLAPHRYLSPFVSEIDYKKEIILDWEYRKSIPCHAVLFEKKLVDSNFISFNESLPNHEDWVFWTQLFYVSKNIKNNNSVLALYRIRENSMSVDYAAMRNGFLNASKVLLDYFKNNDEKELYYAVFIKKKEILNKNRQSVSKKIKSLTQRLLCYIYTNVKTN